MAVADFRAHVAYPCILLESRAFCSQEYHHDCIRWFGARHPQQAIFRLYIPNHLVANLACLLVGFVLLVCLPTQVNFVPFPKTYVSIVGGIGGTASYFAGYKLQAVEFGFSVGATLTILFVEWCAMMLLILKVYGNEKLEEKLETEADQ